MTPYVGSHDTPRLASRADYRGQDEQHPVEVSHHQWAEDGLPVQPVDDEPYERVRLAMCWLLTIPGAPMLYMGDEYGDWGGHDPDNRHLLRREDALSDREAYLLAKVRTLGRTRREQVALRRGGYTSLGSTETMMLFARTTEAGQAAVVAINGAAEEQTIPVSVDGLGFAPDRHRDVLRWGGLLDTRVSPAELLVPPRSCAVFVP